VYHQLQRVFRRYNSPVKDRPLGSTLPFWQLAVSGAFGGWAMTFVQTPLEHVKCRVQVAHTDAAVQPWRTVVQLYKESGITSLYRGFRLTMMREFVGGAIWFGTYELMTRRFKHALPLDAELPAYKIIVCGASSGISYNTVIFPADVAKAVQQTSIVCPSSDAGRPVLKLRSLATTVDANCRVPTIGEIVGFIWRTQGIRGFYKGLSITLIRSAPSSAIAFITYAR
jgi:ornithine carrier protein